MGLRRQNQWYVLTGGPASGKTTLIEQLAARGYAVVHEHARQRIDRALHMGMSVEEARHDQLAFQLGVLEMQLEHESNTPQDQLTFFDRGIPDTLAYQRFHHLPDHPLIAQAVAECRYRKAFILDLLNFVPDYARTEDDNAQHEIQRLLETVYSSLPFPLVHVPVLPVEDRLAFVLANL
jgi:predicted ATPase